MSSEKFGGNFMFGTASSSVQIEGGDKNNTWYNWCNEGHIKDNTSCYTACDHWNKTEQDLALLKKLNVQTYRMSLEWSRLEPMPHRFSSSAVKHYRHEIMMLLQNNIKPLVTLHHFSEPQWFQDAGGWLKPQNTDLFIEFAKYAVENLGDLVCEWVIFNEPNVYAVCGYFAGCFPPGIINVFDTLKVESALIAAHKKVYRLIHDIRSEKGFAGATMVGAAIHIRIFEGISGIGKITAKVIDYLFNELFMEGMTTGKLLFPLTDNSGYKKGRYADFLGINYYTRNIVEFSINPMNWFHKYKKDEELDKNDLGWDIYPKGIYEVSKKYYEKYKLPVYITENGISDKLDNKRSKFIIDHLLYLKNVINEGVDLRRYYHWTLMDNFEWLDGESGYFGLYKNDFASQTRTARKSAALYAEICAAKEINDSSNIITIK